MRNFPINKVFLGGTTIIFSTYFLLSLISSCSGTSASYYQLFNASCVKSYSNPCKRSETFLECINGRCICSSHNHYDEEDQTCQIKYHTKCLFKGKSPLQECIKGSHCAYPLDGNQKPLESAIEGTCQCDITRGYSATDDGLCSNSSVSISNHSLMQLYSCLIFTIISCRLMSGS